MEEKRKKPRKTGRLFLFGRKNCLATPAIRKHSLKLANLFPAKSGFF